MDSTQLEVSKEESPQLEIIEEIKSLPCDKEVSISLEAEIPEALYKGMNEFLAANPKWDQYSLMSSALANFLFQNGSNDRAVTERYLNDLFNLTNS